MVYSIGPVSVQNSILFFSLLCDYLDISAAELTSSEGFFLHLVGNGVGKKSVNKDPHV